ncbi:hypothetical protein DKG77_06750 [Flagellimonas aquimarina]|uniref:Uncharacterized protein n=1 Tax=Flagellimonas aquimarina TaxID=2201895 RepID=A0A316KYS9_9FLAO|nr:hypothetical protein [Allomuricauda koreensis]PWL37985.1 hypothetical protein DKG77_06750 [Allomuricauda koreensis]
MKGNKKISELIAAMCFMILGYVQLYRPNGFFDAIPHFMIALGLVYALFDSSQVYGVNMISKTAKKMVLGPYAKRTSKYNSFKTTMLTVLFVTILLTLGFGMGSAAHHFFR